MESLLLGGACVGAGPLTSLFEVSTLGGGGAAAGSDAGGGGGGASVFGAASLAGAPPAPSFNLNNWSFFSTLPPSSTKNSSMTPAAGDTIGRAVLSVSISPITSSIATLSPTSETY